MPHLPTARGGEAVTPTPEQVEAARVGLGFDRKAPRAWQQLTEDERQEATRRWLAWQLPRPRATVDEISELYE